MSFYLALPSDKLKCEQKNYFYNLWFVKTVFHSKPIIKFLSRTWFEKTTLSCYNFYFFHLWNLLNIQYTSSSNTNVTLTYSFLLQIKMLKDVKDKRNDEAKPNELPYRNNQNLAIARLLHNKNNKNLFVHLSGVNKN